MRRQHNPRGVVSAPRYEHGPGVLIPFVHCVDCKVIMTLSEVPKDLPEGSPILCADCLCIRQTGEQCDH